MIHWSGRWDMEWKYGEEDGGKEKGWRTHERFVK